MMSSHVPLVPIEEERLDFRGGDIYGRNPRRSLFSEPSTSDIYNLPPDLHDPDPAQKFAEIGFEITSSVLGSLISHPCIVLRRQCQVNRKAFRYHLTPVTLLPVTVRLQSRQGLKCLWKGSGGIFILRGCAVALETVMAEVTPFPREVTANSSLKQLAQHLLLKCVTFGLLTPFYCSSLVEIVQSDIASEKPGALDVLREGLRRLFRWGGVPQSTRLLPVWQLIVPTALYGLSIYVISSLVQSVFQWFSSLKREDSLVKDPLGYRSPSVTGTYFNNLSAFQFGSMLASIIMFPAETVLHRLYLQGTRTIIDDLDSGIAVLPVISKYEGVQDCFNTIVAEEGAAGLYKGFGALLLEFALQAAILKVVKVTFREIEVLVRSQTRKKASL